MAPQVCGRGHRHPPRHAQGAGHEARVLQLADAHRHVHTLLGHAGEAIREGHIEGQARVARGQAAQLRHQDAAEDEGHGDLQLALGHLLRLGEELAPSLQPRHRFAAVHGRLSGQVILNPPFPR
jgi:hypothetical protein